MSTPNIIKQFRDNSWMDIYYTDYISGHGDLFLPIDRFAFEPLHTPESIPRNKYLLNRIKNSNKIEIGQITNNSLRWIDYRQFST
jgi:hypothetical protein